MPAEGDIWTSVGTKAKLRKRRITFRGHELEATTRRATMDDEVAILRAGEFSKDTGGLKNIPGAIQEYVRRCVVRSNFDLNAKRFDDKDLRRDTDFLWMLYTWLGVNEAIPTENRKDLVEAFQGKSTGSLTKKTRTPTSKPAFSAVYFDDEA